jgi:hypothetical protein
VFVVEGVLNLADGLADKVARINHKQRQFFPIRPNFNLFKVVIVLKLPVRVVLRQVDL